MKILISIEFLFQYLIGTPYCVTIDYETKDDNCVMIRERDTMLQERVPIEKVREIIAEKLNWRKVLGV